MGGLYTCVEGRQSIRAPDESYKHLSIFSRRKLENFDCVLVFTREANNRGADCWDGDDGGDVDGVDDFGLLLVFGGENAFDAGAICGTWRTDRFLTAL